MNDAEQPINPPEATVPNEPPLDRDELSLERIDAEVMQVGHAFPLDARIKGLLTDWFIDKDMKRDLAKRVLWTKVGKEGVFQTKPARNKETQKSWIMQIDDRSDTDQILNCLTTEDAREIYAGIAS